MEEKKTTVQRQMERAEGKAREKMIAAVVEWTRVRLASNTVSGASTGADKPHALALDLLRGLGQ